jgi:membrane-associated protein
LDQLINIILHLDVHLAEWATWLGPWLYLILFLIIFAETGLVITPFLPGDSLLFAAGALATVPNAPYSVHFLAILLIIAGILGDFVNYSIGKYIGPKIFSREQSKLFNKEHLIRTQQFYEKYGSPTIIIARFAPIIRTFAPFVAGIGNMNYSKFVVYNAAGAITWVSSFLYAGYFFGNIPSVKRNFHFIIIGVIVVSVMPIVIGFFKSRQKSVVSL